MKPFDALTSQDKADIYNWISNIGLEGLAKPQDLKKSLQFWNVCKERLFEGFGHKLRIEFPVEVKMTEYNIVKNLEKVFNPIGLNLREVYGEHNGKSSYTKYLARWITEDCDMDWCSKKTIQTLFSYNNFINGYLNKDYLIEANGKELKLKQGMKTIKALGKLNAFLDSPFDNEFEIFRNKLSDISTIRNIKGTFVLSIHPIDYMTMSDNNCDWSSCMSWKHGSYCGGTLEMMNSQNAIVGYLKSDTPFSDDYSTIDNKQWRCLYYATPYIVLSGKPYPYDCEELIIAGLDKLAEVLYNNLHWDYEMTCPFDDIQHTNLHEPEQVRFDDFEWECNDSYGLIIPYTYGMYNDLIEDQEQKYYCYRNPVDGCEKLCLSGIANCMICGEPMDNDDGWEYAHHTDGWYESHGAVVNCSRCEEKGIIKWQ
ncbi:MAG TPA: hypothetical protein DCW90_17850 [Lachnospiraceae bacterium]|nr:hypothetical protein [Lachnospiraceae bacterium]